MVQVTPQLGGAPKLLLNFGDFKQFFYQTTPKLPYSQDRIVKEKGQKVDGKGTGISWRDEKWTE